ncbi:hypothetical protein [Phenylobacterium sp.]|uniref:hypothetical protein n=1 Tax=Phenylobacterium sp. TaxID=1871053 RepID=UPI0035B37BAF
MGAFRTIILALAGAAILAAPAAASEDDWPVLKGARLDGQMPWGAFAVYRAGDRPTTGVTLFVRDNALIARRVETPSGEAAAITWASSRTCPALAPALAELETLPPARIEVPLAGRKPAAPDQPADGSSYFVWVQDARLGNVRHSGQLELRATDGSPPALWMEKALRRLAPCWTSARP